MRGPELLNRVHCLRIQQAHNRTEDQILARVLLAVTISRLQILRNVDTNVGTIKGSKTILKKRKEFEMSSDESRCTWRW